MKWLWLVVAGAALATVACAEDGGEGDEGVAAKCGAVTCSTDEYCCDAACGLCVEMDVACNMTCE